MKHIIAALERNGFKVISSKDNFIDVSLSDADTKHIENIFVTEGIEAVDNEIAKYGSFVIKNSKLDNSVKVDGYSVDDTKNLIAVRFIADDGGAKTKLMGISETESGKYPLSSLHDTLVNLRTVPKSGGDVALMAKWRKIREAALKLRAFVKKISEEEIPKKEVQDVVTDAVELLEDGLDIEVIPEKPKPEVKPKAEEKPKPEVKPKAVEKPEFKIEPKPEKKVENINTSTVNLRRKLINAKKIIGQKGYDPVTDTYSGKPEGEPTVAQEVKPNYYVHGEPTAMEFAREIAPGEGKPADAPFLAQEKRAVKVMALIDEAIEKSLIDPEDKTKEFETALRMTDQELIKYERKIKTASGRPSELISDGRYADINNIFS